ncbi:baseplate J/gp47 family protein [Marimonas arenosa]|uniref:Baseplate J/gp47 family protein n=1 Tax=Marimonas arenosa TaxID=1795305 RepID=A0AAE3W9U7_9RHOB|nr:baseplate J/gp47 family protein [Marimonas arenosa]MDQ2088739.1 baseplate J/gp47 family protein [Marimonas arenosa]
MLDAAGLLDRYGALLRAGGTNRLQRTPPALEPDYVRPDERNLGELFANVAALAAELRFHTESGQAAGDWAPLFDPLRDGAGELLNTAALEALAAGRDDLPPQLALLFAFFAAYGHIRDEFDRLPARHLTHWYEGILKLDRAAAVPDQVHLVFEMAPGADRVLLESGTSFEAGTDAQGRPLRYALERETVISPALVGQVARSLTAEDPQGRLRLFRAEAPGGAGFATFGADPFGPEAAAEGMTEVDPGFALADPVLRLAEGERQIAVTLTLAQVESAAPPPGLTLTPFVTLEFSGAEGWLVPEEFSAELDVSGPDPVLNLTAALPVEAPAVVDFDPALHVDETAPAPRPDRAAPVLRCLVKSPSGHARLWNGLAVTDVQIAVEADGLTDLVVQNDERTLDPAKPMPLFTQRPRIGANFYVGAQEIFAKRLDRLSVDFTWDGMPQDLLSHYAGYFDWTDSVLASVFRPSFTAVVDMLDRRSWDHRLTGPVGVLQLFAPQGESQGISFGAAAFDNAYAGRAYEPAPDLAEADRYGTGIKRGFLRLRLTGPRNEDIANGGVTYAQDVPFEAFGQDAFARRYAKAAIALAQYDSEAPGAGPEPVLPNEPWTPMLSELRLGYGSHSQFAPGDTQAAGSFFTIGVFGYTEAGGGGALARLADAPPEAAVLHLGLEGFTPPGTASFLFQLQEGTAGIAAPPGPEELAWSYLGAEGWVELPASALVADETRGFQTPGVVAVAVGHDAVQDSTLMPAGMTWLRVVLQAPPGVAARTAAVDAPAATAAFAPPEGSALADFSEHLTEGLAAGTITRLSKRRLGIKAVRQPQPSFGGRGVEADAGYFERNAERLRHRNRAVTPWDFERRVLERFPGVFKARALPHSTAENDAAPGVLSIVIVPNLRASQSANPLEPRAGETLMQEIRDFITDGIASPFADIQVVHPVYERVRVDAGIAFRPGRDPGFYSEQLNGDIQRFLSPWAFEEGRDIVFGTRIYRSELLKFVEDRDYVDYVTRFDVYHAFDGPPRDGIGNMEVGLDFVVGSDPEPALSAMTIGEDFIVGRPVQTAASARARAVLVSHPQHFIEPVFPGSETCTGVTQLSIGQMIVGLDFQSAAS